MNDPAIVVTTVVLNWNRADLLKRTLDSYSRTIGVPHEVIVVDNASTDGSRSVIDEFCTAHPGADAIVLDENRGGAALNQGLARARGRLLHLSENDLEYLPGWSERVVDAFDSFPELGQLSVFGPVPGDDEAWELKPSALRHAQGRIVYEALGNVGTSSILRREIWDRGVRIENKATTGSFLFPDDEALSRDVRRLGYLVAWADHYLVQNVGHSLDEFTHRAEYYRRNYASKSWLGIDGWQRRVATQTARPRPARSTFLPLAAPVSPEKSFPSTECPEPQLWSMLDGWTAELETLEFLYGLVRLLKPRFVVETGTWHGHAAAAIGHALRANGRGRVETLEIDGPTSEVAGARIDASGVSEVVRVLTLPSLAYEPPEAIDLLLLDSDLGARESEFRHLASHLSPAAIVVFHDTSEAHALVRQGVERLEREGLLKVLWFPTPRGLTLCQSTA